MAMTIFPLSGPTPARRGATEMAAQTEHAADDPVVAAARWAALERGFASPKAVPTPQVSEDRAPAFQTIRRLFFAQLFGAENGQEIMGRGYVETDGLADAYREKLAVATAQTGRLFRAEGISFTPPAAITVGSDGRLHADADHPDAARIDDLLGREPDLRSTLIGLSALGGRLRAAEDGSAFAAAYQADQAGALDSFAHLLSPAAPDFIAVVDEKGVGAQFRWPDGAARAWAPGGA